MVEESSNYTTYVCIHVYYVYSVYSALRIHHGLLCCGLYSIFHIVVLVFRVQYNG